MRSALRENRPPQQSASSPGAPFGRLPPLPLGPVCHRGQPQSRGISRSRARPTGTGWTRRVLLKAARDSTGPVRTPGSGIGPHPGTASSKGACPVKAQSGHVRPGSASGPAPRRGPRSASRPYGRPAVPFGPAGRQRYATRTNIEDALHAVHTPTCGNAATDASPEPDSGTKLTAATTSPARLGAKDHQQAPTPPNLPQAGHLPPERGCRSPRRAG